MSQFFPMSDSALMVRDGGRRRYRPATAEQILAAARQVIDQKMQRGASLQSPADARSYLRVKLAGYDYEVFALLLLDYGPSTDRVCRIVPRNDRRRVRASA